MRVTGLTRHSGEECVPCQAWLRPGIGVGGIGDWLMLWPAASKLRSLHRLDPGATAGSDSAEHSITTAAQPAGASATNAPGRRMAFHRTRRTIMRVGVTKDHHLVVDRCGVKWFITFDGHRKLANSAAGRAKTRWYPGEPGQHEACASITSDARDGCHFVHSAAPDVAKYCFNCSIPGNVGWGAFARCEEVVIVKVADCRHSLIKVPGRSKRCWRATIIVLPATFSTTHSRRSDDRLPRSSNAAWAEEYC